jgi:hypothetical protein
VRHRSLDGGFVERSGLGFHDAEPTARRLGRLDDPCYLSAP